MRTTTRRFETRVFVWSAVRLLVAIVLILALMLAHPISRIVDASQRNFDACVTSSNASAQGKQTSTERYTQLGDCAASP
ncbi:hypothetical protein [Burkholderia sp. S171]|uniref:hypothetical protein n=1 Tax=Burkholderia sp. S171 TaxID=1641860 RepID=UPI00131C85AE|nr:hypothetical protein [Burkholderia sp. S171]